MSQPFDRFVRMLPIVFVLATNVACNGGSQNDSGVTTDASDVPVQADASIPSTASGVTAMQCASAIDLASAGMLMGDTITVQGSTATPTTIMAAACNPAVTGQQVYRYVVRGDQVSLRATTAIAGGTEGLDTVAWVLPGACSEQLTPIACNDDDPNTPDAFLGDSTLRTPTLTHGTEVTIVVGAYAHTRRGAQTRGNFMLAVNEIPAAARGAMCDSSNPGTCAVGSECAATSPTAGLCVSPGTETEPNDSPATANPVTVTQPIAIHASIMPAGDHDCFAFDAPGGMDLYLEASDGAGGCPADLRADLYRAGEMFPFDGDDDSGRTSDTACPRVDATDNASVHALAAGRYIVCVSVSEPAMTPPTVTVPQYSLQIAFE